MAWFLFGLAALACCVSYVIGDYRGFKRGKQGSYELWCSRMARENRALVWPAHDLHSRVGDNVQAVDVARDRADGGRVGHRVIEL